MRSSKDELQLRGFTCETASCHHGVVSEWLKAESNPSVAGPGEPQHLVLYSYNKDANISCTHFLFLLCSQQSFFTFLVF